MRYFCLAFLMSGLFIVSGSHVEAQPPPPPSAQPSTQPPPTPTPAPAPTQAPAPAPTPVPETKKFERDETSVTIPYFLAGLAVTVVLLLVCMPARRE